VDQAPDSFLEIVWERSGRRSWSGSPSMRSPGRCGARLMQWPASARSQTRLPTRPRGLLVDQDFATEDADAAEPTGRPCAICGTAMEHWRPRSQKYCSDRCRTAAAKKQRTEQPRDSPKVPRPKPPAASRAGSAGSPCRGRPRAATSRGLSRADGGPASPGSGPNV